ncbi:dynamin family protein [Pelotomaculum terephthalicicum JT]|uniref:dynamin family protein n=1 Tax=Pelotomaculum TaxID=191373 RepID=UPI0009C57FC0|nr:MULTISPECIES: dynamin family protein [Pelotomaculum]MCG9969000.1 dynamin family protein [Pelotomaculum terephthalicicum JT]OPX87672.1 MAG: Bacterial dynamin-like protein [Pelotomaculum sp. PtaB.Bin117]OPY61128.1 MAG: Bacterial dynamin-like protein [Pelotomaculum sp. PtaU1.Bin065]
MEQSYGKLRTKVLENLGLLENIAKQREIVHLVEYLEEIKQKLLHGRFNLVVLGEFKRGKTTFLNALLGEDLLPTAVVPLTSIVTLIQYGEKISVKVTFSDGGAAEATLDDLPLYVTEEGNPCNEKNVKLVHLEYPSPYLNDGVVLIDTPGVGSVYRNNTDETYNYLPKVDAAIFLLSSDQPISQSELDFLKDIEQYSAKTFFILNKIDYLNEQDKKKALEFAKKVLAEKVGFEEINIYPVSAKLALDGKISCDDEKLKASNLPAFTNILENFLLKEKGRAAINATCNKGNNAAGELQLGLELEMKALGIPLEELKAKITLFDEMVMNLRQEQEDNGYIFQGEKSKVYQELEHEITVFQESQNMIIAKDIEQEYQAKKELSGRKLMHYLEDYIEKKVLTAFDEWQPKVEEKVREAFDRVIARFTNKTNKVIGELLKQSAEIFDLKVEGFTEAEALTEETKLYYILGEQANMFIPNAANLYALFLPKFITGPMIMRVMRKKVEQDLDRNCGRLRTDYNDRISKSVKVFKNLLEEKFNSAIEGTRLVLTRVIEKREHSEKEAAEAYEKLAEQMKTLESARESLREIAGVRVNLQTSKIPGVLMTL